MFKLNHTKTLVIAVILAIAATTAVAQYIPNEDLEPGMEAAKTEIFVPVDNARLFSVPTANVIKNMDICAEGGGFMGTNDNNALIGTIGFGLGDVAQVNMSASEILSSVTKGNRSVAVAAFKLRVIPETQYVPAVAAIVNRSFETDYQGFKMNQVDISSVASKGFSDNKVNLTVGGRLSLASLQPDSGIVGAEKKALKTVHPMVGLRIRANPQTFVMLECETAPVYNVNELTAVNLKNAGTQSFVLGGLGVRYYFTSWLSLDTGTRIEIKPDEYNVALKGKMNAAIPVRAVLKRASNAI